MSNTSDTPMEERFKGASIAYKTYCSYVENLIKNIGKDKTFEILSASEKERGTKVGKLVKGKKPEEQYDLKKITDTIVEMALDIAGMDDILEINDERAVTRTRLGKCPIYEAAHSCGIPDERIEEMCRAGSLVFLDSVVEQLNPKFTYKVQKFRSIEDGGCVEEIVFRDK